MGKKKYHSNKTVCDGIERGVLKLNKMFSCLHLLGFDVLRNTERDCPVTQKKRCSQCFGTKNSVSTSIIGKIVTVDTL